MNLRPVFLNVRLNALSIVLHRTTAALADQDHIVAAVT
jgi:hypothetical protein